MSDPRFPAPDSGDEWGTRRALQVLALAFLFPAATVVGYSAGAWLGGHAGARMAGGLLGGAVGATAGFWQLFLFLRRPTR